MDNKYCYKIMVTYIYLDGTADEYYLNGVYIDFNKVVAKADKTMKDILEQADFDHEEIEHGDYEYQIMTYLKSHPKIESIWVEVEQGKEILD